MIVSWTMMTNRRRDRRYSDVRVSGCAGIRKVYVMMRWTVGMIMIYVVVIGFRMA